MTDTLVAAPATDPTPTGPDALLAESADIAGAVVDLMRQLHGIKARLAVGPEADHSPLLLLAKLVRSGPQRASALADLGGADPSTVSRQVAAACLLVPTALGRERVQEYWQRRAAAMAPLVQDWTAHERADFLRLLRKYVTSIDTHRDDVIATLTAHPQKGQ
jgi:DNA-binding MarR family transcriptional regulator